MVAWIPQPAERAKISEDEDSIPTQPAPDTRLFFDDELDELETSARRRQPSRVSDGQKGQRWLIVRPVNGLCNRFRSIISAMLLAKDLGRTLVLDWRPSQACNCEWQRLVGNIPGLRLDLERLAEAEESVAAAMELQRLWHLVCSHAQKSQFRTLLESYVHLHQEYFRAGLAYYLDAQSSELAAFSPKMSNRRVNDSDLPNFLKVKCLVVCAYEEFYPPISERIAAGVAARSLELNRLKPARGVAKHVWQLPKQTLAVHVRRTDHQAACHRSPLELFFHAVDKHSHSEKQKIFLATDDPTVEESFKHRYGKRLLLHSKRTLDRGAPEGIEDAFVDLLLLSQGVEIIGSYESSFTDIASLFRQVPLHIVDTGDVSAPALCGPCDGRNSLQFLVSKFGADENDAWGPSD